MNIRETNFVKSIRMSIIKRFLVEIPMYAFFLTGMVNKQPITLNMTLMGLIYAIILTLVVGGKPDPKAKDDSFKEAGQKFVVRDIIIYFVLFILINFYVMQK